VAISRIHLKMYEVSAAEYKKIGHSAGGCCVVLHVRRLLPLVADDTHGLSSLNVFDVPFNMWLSSHVPSTTLLRPRLWTERSFRSKGWPQMRTDMMAIVARGNLIL